MSEEISQSEIPKKKCYTCEICDNEFTFKCILVNHINRIHSDIGTSNKCDICSKSFTFLGNLKQRWIQGRTASPHSTVRNIFVF